MSFKPARLPQGPRAVKPWRVTARQRQFIELRYQKALTLKAACRSMNITYRTGSWHAEYIALKLGLAGKGSTTLDKPFLILQKLIRLGLVQIESEEPK